MLNVQTIAYVTSNMNESRERNILLCYLLVLDECFAGFYSIDPWPTAHVICKQNKLKKRGMCFPEFYLDSLIMANNDNTVSHNYGY